MKKLLALSALIFAFTAVSAMADDCGQHKDKGKGTPGCHDKGGNPGGSGSGSSSPIVVTNENLNNINLKNTNMNNNTSSSNSSSTSNSASTASSSSKSSSNSNATATGGNAFSIQSQTAQGGNASNGGQQNTQTTEFNQVHQTPVAIAPEAVSTAPCRISGSGGGSSPFFGVSFSGSRVDTECEKRATAVAFAQLGEKTAALEMICSTNAAKKSDVMICKALADYKKNGGRVVVDAPQQ